MVIYMYIYQGRWWSNKTRSHKRSKKKVEQNFFCTNWYTFCAGRKKVRKIEPIKNYIYVNFNTYIYIFQSFYVYIRIHRYTSSCKAMAMLKVILLLLIISSTCKLFDVNLLNIIISIKYFYSCWCSFTS